MVDSIKREANKARFAEKNARRKEAAERCPNRHQRREAKWRRKVRDGAFMHEPKRKDWAYGTMGYFFIENQRPPKDEDE